MRKCYRVGRPTLWYDNSPKLLGPQLKPCVRTKARIVKKNEQEKKKRRLKGMSPRGSTRLWLDDPYLVFGAKHASVHKRSRHDSQTRGFPSAEGKHRSHRL